MLSGVAQHKITCENMHPVHFVWLQSRTVVGARTYVFSAGMCMAVWVFTEFEVHKLTVVT